MVFNNVSVSVLVYLVSNAVCNPLVLAIVKLPSVIVACLVFNNVSVSVLVYLVSHAVWHDVTWLIPIDPVTSNLSSKADSKPVTRLSNIGSVLPVLASSCDCKLLTLLISIALLTTLDQFVFFPASKLEAAVNLESNDVDRPLILEMLIAPSTSF